MFRINRQSNIIEKIERKTFSELLFREREHLQEWIAATPEALGEELLIIQKEFDGFDDTRERLDLLAVDKQGRLVVIENKLDDTGRDVVWQALKYASYCSTLKKAKVAEIFRTYLTACGEETSAEEILTDFLEADDFDSLVLNRGNEQRLILIAANFRREVTATVLWLLTHGIDIRCIKVNPFMMGDEILLNFEQIIPTPEAADYMIGISEKEAEVKQAEGVERQSHTLRREFWELCLERFRQSDVDLFDNINPHKDHWSSAGSGVSGCPYDLIFSKKEARVELAFARSDRHENKRIFDLLFEQKDEIESEFGAPLIWKRLDDRKSSRIEYQKGFDGFNRDNWPDMIDWMIHHMRKLESALSRRFKEAVAQIN